MRVFCHIGSGFIGICIYNIYINKKMLKTINNKLTVYGTFVSRITNYMFMYIYIVPGVK